MGHWSSTSPFIRTSRKRWAAGMMTVAPSAYVARQIPDRWKQRFGSLHDASVTMTFLAPASNASLTTLRHHAGFVLAACTGMRSQPMFGLIARCRRSR